MPADLNLAHLRELAVRLAHAAGEELLARQQSLSIDADGVETKSSASDPVSAADRASEKLITDGITTARPGDGLLGEEGASRPSTTGLTWVIDPLDGTVNYLYGRPDWCVSIAVEDEQGALIGVVHQPRTNTTWQATRTAGSYRTTSSSSTAGSYRTDPPPYQTVWYAGSPTHRSPEPPYQTVWYGERRLRVGEGRREVGLAEALVCTGFSYLPDRRAEQAEHLRRVLPAVRDIRRGGSAALDLCSVADGTADAYYEHVIQPWDIAAGALIAREAGATVVRDPAFPQGILAAAPAVAEPLRELLTTTRRQE
ncbi:inositol monophosphatase family protein [Kribbella solani]|uniref:inositol monophosphatase family protein n=1 Tax=Kribbella solani TaxID=236067 RepID=UPI0029AE9CA6|nr:inositol monophosphatase family protein [Kribbella solani]MDX2974371.1 inositol monophosphatase family protein [Kribbella solani]MDX3006702.1 inositol monophosphatase family protein [Kribbella solani]